MFLFLTTVRLSRSSRPLASSDVCLVVELPACPSVHKGSLIYSVEKMKRDSSFNPHHVEYVTGHLYHLRRCALTAGLTNVSENMHPEINRQRYQSDNNN